MNEEPRFGEVWKWQDMGPFMVIALQDSGYAKSPRDIVTIELGNRETATLHWDGRFRDDWQRIDEGELV